MNILLLSAYEAISHRLWREGLIAHFSDYQWQWLTLSPRHFQWRIRGNPLSWLGEHESTLKQPYDLIIATSMVDLSTLRGLVPELASTPTMLYMHENQFAYPDSSAAAEQRASQQLNAQMVNLYAMLAADCVAFNSLWNFQSCIDGIERLSRKLPERIAPALVDRLRDKSCVLPVSIELPDKAGTPESRPDQRLQLVWNHRWEFDKGPERLLAFVQAIKRARLPVTLSVVGQRFREVPVALQELEQLLMGSEDHDSLQCGRWGPISNRDEYLRLLSSSDVVLSTALHDFQGLSVMEGVAHGCVPLLPKRLAYPNYFDEAYLYQSNDDITQEAASACGRLGQWMRSGLPEVPDLSALSWSQLSVRYRSVFEALRRR